MTNLMTGAAVGDPMHGHAGGGVITRVEDIPTTEAVFDVGALSLSDGAAVTAIPDTQGNRPDLAQATTSRQPIYRANAYASGLPGAEFDGVADFLISPGEYTAVNDRVSFVFVSSVVGGSGQPIPFGESNGGATIISARRASASQTRLQYRNDSNVTAVDTVFTNNLYNGRTVATVIFDFNALQATVRRNLETAQTFALNGAGRAAPGSVQNLSIGCNARVNGTSPVDFAEMFLHKFVIMLNASAAQEELAATILMDEWSVT